MAIIFSPFWYHNLFERSDGDSFYAITLYIFNGYH